MTDQKTLSDDIAFMRALAEAGQGTPLAGGAILLASGLAFGTASLVLWASAIGRLALKNWQVNVVWLAASAIFIAVLVAVQRGRPPQGQGAKAVSIAWSGAGIACFAIGLSLAIISARGGGAIVVAAFPPIILALYGGCFFVAAAVSRARWLYAVAIGSFVMAVVSAWFATEGATLYLVYGLSLLALDALPGFVLMRQARRAA